jgi:RNA polymerase sigma-70 factor (ECF subfamily)
LHDVEPAVAASRFGPLGEWAVPPPHWSDEIDDQLAAVVLASRARDVIDTLPDQQRQVVTLRDERGLTSQEVCDVLDITEGHQRVLLHRARSRVRGALERQMAKD